MAATAGYVTEIRSGSSATVIDGLIEASITATSLSSELGQCSVMLADGRFLRIWIY